MMSGFDSQLADSHNQTLCLLRILAMTATLPPSHLIAQHVASALAEDIGPRDWTAELIPANTIARATVVAREAGGDCRSGLV